VAWLAARVREPSAGYLGLLDSSAPVVFERRLASPWLSFPVSARGGLRQVLTHSAQHRSQVLCWLAGRGVPTPDLDYAVMLGALRRPG
jgi:hypothetical protein